MNALRQLSPTVRASTDRAWRREPAVRIIDCVLSLNRKYDAVVVPRLDRFERDRPLVRSVVDLNEEIASYPSPYEFVRHTLSYNDIDRAEILAKVARWLSTIGGGGTPDEQLTNLESWARSARYDGYQTLGIRGFALAGFQYLRMLFGANTTKPDKRICQWVAEVVGHRVSPVQAFQLLEPAAAEANVSLRDADTTIWEILARGSSGPGVASRHR